MLDLLMMQVHSNVWAECDKHLSVVILKLIKINEQI